MSLPDFKQFYRRLKKQELVEVLDFAITRSHYLLASWMNTLLEKHPEVKEELKAFMKERGKLMGEQLLSEIDPQIAWRRDATTWWECERRFLDPYIKGRILGVKLMELTPNTCRFRFTHCAFLKGWAYATVKPEDMCEILKETERGLAEAINPNLELVEFNPGLARFEPYCQLTIKLRKK